MNDFLDKFAKIPPGQKILAGVLVTGVLALLYYQFFYSDLQEQQTRLDAEYNRVETERRDYEKRKAEYVAFKQEVSRLEEEQKELLKVLPKASEIPAFIDSIHTQATLAGLEIVSFTPLPEQPQDVYARIPVAMEVAGNYHQIGKFAKIVGELKRIVNIENLDLGAPAIRDGVVSLHARFIAATFRFQERAPAPARKK